jgi:hypothetical protein
VIGLIVLGVLVLGFVALVWWGSTLPPTRPRPGNRSRGRSELNVHEDLEARRRHP